MFSVNGDVVLDPFLGTGTTTIGAMASGRNSIGYEIDNNFKEFIEDRINEIGNIVDEYVKDRLEKHQIFVKKRKEEKGELKYLSKNYKFPVMTRQEINIHIQKIKEVNKINESLFEVEHLF